MGFDVFWEVVGGGVGDLVVVGGEYVLLGVCGDVGCCAAVLGAGEGVGLGFGPRGGCGVL